MNNDILKDAIYTGIEGEAIKATIEDIVVKSEENNVNPIQMKKAIEEIAHMKKNINSIPDKKYASNLVKENSTRIKSALNEGISPNEIAATLMDSVQKANSRRTKSRLRFITKLITKMKQKELVLQKQNEKSMEKGRQKVLSNK